jgi:hypothetical protein
MGMLFLIKVLTVISSAFALLFKDKIVKVPDVLLGLKFNRDIANQGCLLYTVSWQPSG